MADRIYSFEALGTHWHITLLETDWLPELRQVVEQTVRQFESDYSRFKAGSFVGRLNDDKVLPNPPEEMVDMLGYALEMYDRTDGLFNISVGGRLEQLGYGKQADASAVISTDLAADVRMSPEKITISPHTRLDFGGFGKGWLIDKIGRLLQSKGVGLFIINGGGDILVSSTSPVEIPIEHPFDPTMSVGSAQISHGSLAASSGLKRSWKIAGGEIVHHIIDPDKGESSAHDAAMHIYADSALIADTLSTVLLLAAPDMRPELAQKSNVSYLSIGTDLRFYQSPGFPAAMHS